MDLAKLEDTLTQIQDGLNGGGAINYTASLRVFAAPGKGHLPLQAAISAALGAPAVLGGSASCSVADVVTEIVSAIRYVGGAGSHPCESFLNSQALRELVAEVSDQASQWAESADLLTSIWLKDGHPFYPVFWDFAFLAIHGSNATLVIGSSSD